MIKIALVEDSYEQSKELQSFLKKYFFENKIQIEIKAFERADDILKGFSSGLYDMIFMDIEMPGTDGMTASKILRKIDENVLILFVTNLAQYALEGYEVQAFDYIVKPVNYYNLALKMKRALGALKNLENKTIILSTNLGKRIIETQKIKYVEVMKHNVIYHTTEGNFLVGYDSMKNVEQKLADYDFVLSDRSFLVNLKYVTGINKDDIYLGNETLKLTKSRKAEFVLKMTKYFSSEDDE